jgi:hypothetical protein
MPPLILLRITVFALISSLKWLFDNNLLPKEVEALADSIRNPLLARPLHNPIAALLHQLERTANLHVRHLGESRMRLEHPGTLGARRAFYLLP